MLKEIWTLAVTDFKATFEGGYLYLLLLACLIYLFIKEKNASRKTIFLWTTLFTLFLYFCPLSGKILGECLGDNVYFRVLWLIPLIPLTCYVMTTLVSKLQGVKRFAAFCVLVLCIMGSGSYMLTGQHFHEVTNPYKLTQESVDTAQWIPDGAHVVGVGWLLPFIRQYNPTITLAYDRYYQGPLALELSKPNPDLAVCGPLLQETGCDFVAIGQDLNSGVLGNWNDYGFHFYRGDNRCIIFINENSSFYSGEP